MQSYVCNRYPREATLKDGTVVTLTPMVPSDWELVGTFLAAIGDEDRVYLRHDISDPKIVERWCSELNYNVVFPLLAWIEGKVVADATLNQDPGLWTAHLAKLRVLVHPEYRRRGLGMLLARELLTVARERELSKAVVECAAEQASLIQFLKRARFREAGRLDGFVRDRNGRTHEMVLFVQNLSGGPETE